MTENIPGGRPRASSEGDIFEDYGDERPYNSPPLSSYHREVSKSSHLSGKAAQQPVDVNDNAYNESQTKHKRRSRPSFKRLQLKNWMQRLINSSNSEKTGPSGGKGGWVPDGRQNEPTGAKSNQRRDYGYTESTARPLVTKPIPKPTPWDLTPGTLGIQNHGNTCFMNAVLQCLNNSDCFSEYFITKKYKEDLNSNKGLKRFAGPKADVTEHLANLIESLWSNRYTPELSNVFKSVVGKYNHQYKGSSQHDSQEFLLWLLDRINEDLLVSSKKKKNLVKCHSHTDEAAAEETLISCNGCCVYNLFQALYRSSLKCPNCGKQSNTFETYLCLSLPLPHHVTRPVYVTIVQPDNHPKQIKVGLRLNVHDTVKELRDKISEDTHIPRSQIVLCQIYDDGFRNTYGDDEPLTNIPEFETVYAIEMLPASSPAQGHTSSEFESTCIQIIVTHIERINTPSKCYRFCSPQVLKISRDLDYKELQKDILMDMNGCVEEGLVSQKLDVLFKLRVVDGCPGRSYLPTDVDMPLFTQTIDRALSTYDDKYGPQHVKLVAEWETHVRDRVVVYDDYEAEESSSVKQVRHQQPVRISLDECFRLFTKEETLTGEDAWLCTHCGKQQQGATKTLGLWSLPDILIIHLKRFRQRTKLNTLIDFPVSGLNMSRHVVQDDGSECQNRCPSSTSRLQRLHQQPGNQEYIYDLYGVCNHYGNMNGGHYTAFCKNPLDSKWYEYDDTRVKLMGEAEVKTSSAYILFYQKRGISAIISDELKSGTHWIYNLYPIPTSNSSSSSHDTSSSYGTRDESEKQTHVRKNVAERDTHVNDKHTGPYSRQTSYSTAIKQGGVQTSGQDYMSKYADERDLRVKLPEKPRETRSQNSDQDNDIYHDRINDNQKHRVKNSEITELENRNRTTDIIPGDRNQNNSAVRQEESERPYSSSYNTPQQSRRQVSCSSQNSAKQAWLTPQPTRKHASDDYVAPSPKPFVRQMSVPSRSPNKDQNKEDRPRRSPTKSQNQSSINRSPSVPPQGSRREERNLDDDVRYKDTRKTNDYDKKYATIARVNRKQTEKPFDQEGSNIPRSKTDNSIVSKTKPPPSYKQGQGHDHAVRDDQGHTHDRMVRENHVLPTSHQKPPIQPNNQTPKNKTVKSVSSTQSDRRPTYNPDNYSMSVNGITAVTNGVQNDLILNNGYYHQNVNSQPSRDRSDNNRFRESPKPPRPPPPRDVRSQDYEEERANYLANQGIVSNSVATTPSLNEARSRKPFIDSNGDSFSYTENYPRYRPHRYFYTDYANKDQKKYFMKEKKYSPCLKESSV